VHKHPANPLWGEDKPWEVRFDNLYPNVLYDADEKIYKCWYNPFIVDKATTGVPRAERSNVEYRPKKGRETGVCYATSKDGIKWEKPELGLVDFNGSKANNLILRNTHGPGIFKDARETDPAKRYKMIQQGMAVRFSSDGIRWSDAISCKEISAVGDTHNNAFWAPELGEYVGITRWKIPQRVVVRTQSPDFIHWTKAAEVYRGDVNNQTYAMPVFRYEHVYLGLVMMYRIHPDDRVACELAWSPDTIAWMAIDPGNALIPLSEKPGDYDWGCIYAAAYPIVLENEIRLYYGASNGPHMGWRDGFFALAKLRKDGWAGYVPIDPHKSGTVLTKPLACNASTLHVSADIGSGSLKVVVMDANGETLANSKPMTGDVTDAAVAWAPADALAGLQGKVIRLRFELHGAKLYSFGFSQ